MSSFRHMVSPKRMLQSPVTFNNAKRATYPIVFRNPCGFHKTVTTDSSAKQYRDALTSRILPQMVLSKGDKTSKTPYPAPLPENLNAKERALKRFMVTGNAIVAGGAGGLGLEASKALLEHGLSGLMIFDVNPSQCQSKITALQDAFPSAQIICKKVDVSDDVAVARAVEETASELGSVDTLLYYAGIVDCEHALEMTAAKFRRTIDINTTGAFLCAQAVAKQMVKQDSGGSIMFVASISGHRVNFPQPQVAYNTSKGALLVMKTSLAAEWGRYGIRVNTISPGYMDTILNEGDGIAVVRKIWADRNPMGRMGKPSELSGAVVLLSSNAGTYINGTDIVVDGGQIVF